MYFKFDCAATCPYPQMILKLISSHPSRIQTYDISLLTGAPSVPKNEISKLGIPNDVRLNSNLFDDR